MPTASGLGQLPKDLLLPSRKRSELWPPGICRPSVFTICFAYFWPGTGQRSNSVLRTPVLPKLIFGKLAEFAPELAKNIDFAEHTIPQAEAFIATGSNRSARYFEQYLGKYPSIIRQNRSSVAVLDGSETDETLSALAEDIVSYYGLGCRNVSKLFLPENYPLEKIMAATDRPELMNNPQIRQ